MPRFAKLRSRKAGLPPGTPVHIGERRIDASRLRLTHYTAAQVTEREAVTVDACAAPRGTGITWVHVTGVHDVALLSRLGSGFGLHPLVLEDIANTDQRPKLEDYGEYVYIVLRLLHDGADRRLQGRRRYGFRDEGGRRRRGRAAEGNARSGCRNSDRAGEPDLRARFRAVVRGSRTDRVRQRA